MKKGTREEHSRWFARTLRLGVLLLSSFLWSTRFFKNSRRCRSIETQEKKVHINSIVL